MRKVGLIVWAMVVMMSSGVFAATGTGTLNRASGWYQSGSNFTVTATAASNSSFSAWQGDTNGCTLAGSQITLTADKYKQITALFSILKFPLSVVSPYGTATPAVGTSTNEYGTVVNASVTSPVTVGVTTQYVCSGWAMTGNGPASGTTTNFTMTQTNTAALTWLWKTNYYLTTAVSGSGAVNVASSWYPSGTSVVVTATASNGWNFTSWSGNTNGCTLAGSQVTAPMTQARGVTANFVLSQKALQVISPFGITIPAVGTSSNNWGSVVNCSVTNSPVTMGTTQYVCTGWAMAGNAPLSGSGTNFTMTVTNNAVLNWQWSTNFWIDLNISGN